MGQSAIVRLTRFLPDSIRAQLASGMLVLVSAVVAATGAVLYQGQPLFWPLLGVLLVAAAGGAALLVWRALLPLDALMEGARAIGQGRFDTRIRVPRGSEWKALATTLNEMAANLKSAQTEHTAQERLLQQLQIAHQIQASLLPGQPPPVPGAKLSAFYRSAFEVGGDYYDFLSLPSGQIAIIVADVSGKGVPASLVMACVRTFLRSIAPALVTPAEVMVRLNRFVCRDLREGLFITMVYALFDPQRRLLKLASAGHDPALVVRAGGEATNHKPPGFPVGIDDGPLFAERLKEETLKLGGGDIVLLYTDGVTDCADPGGNRFGRTRLEELVRRERGGDADAVVQRVERELVAFSGGTDPVDDQTVVLLTVGETGEARSLGGRW